MISVSEFVRAQLKLGNREPDKIAREWIEIALRSSDPRVAFYQPVRHTVGSVFSRLQRGLREQTEADYSRTTTPAGVRALTRQTHNDAMVYNPESGLWVELGLATVGDFRAAIAAHEATIAGLRGTQKMYQRYIAMIQEAGVSCLSQVPGWPEGRAS